MAVKPTFSQEISNLLYASHGHPLAVCMQCGLCSASCPVVDHMDNSPRRIIAMIHADLKDEVLKSTTFWYCASCYNCTVRCPRGINIAEMMYGLKRYSMWRNRYDKSLIGPDFSERFVKMIVKTGRSWEPALAPSFIFKGGVKGFLYDTQMALRLVRRGRMPMTPSKIKRIKGFRRMLGRIIPLAGVE
jgi:heterodisulfide reductase subunit C